MKTELTFMILLIGIILSYQVLAVEPVWSVSGLKMPESVEYDNVNNRYYVSNINDGVNAENGNGSIGLIDSNGKLLNVDWVTGLHSPKGLALYNNKLYVADVKQLVVINVDSARVIARYDAPNSVALNGITVNNSGKIFISDWIGNRIYVLEKGELKVWLDTVDLNSPNGLWVNNTDLYVAIWGRNPKDDFTTETSGSIKKISLISKEILTNKQNGQWINMDGISAYEKDKWLVSDFLKGEILLLNSKGKIEKSIKTKKGSADFYYVNEKKLLVVPLMMDNQVVAYKLD